MWNTGDESSAVRGGAMASPGRTGRMAGVFLVVTFLAAGLLGAVQPATGVPDEVIQLTQFGPALGVATAALVWPKRMRSLLAGALHGDRHSPRNGVPLLLLTAPLVIALCAGTYAIATRDAHFTAPGALRHSFPFIVVAQFVGACGEEIGWRCFLQPLLRTHFGTLVSSVAVGLLWGVWHVQVFGQAPAYAGGFLLGSVSLSVVMGLALDRVRAWRLPLAGGFHALINLGMLLFMDEESGAVLPMVLFGAASLLTGLLWAWRTRARIHGFRRIPDPVR
jgi:membrane protease YdiL (CAAX protease family)